MSPSMLPGEDEPEQPGSFKLPAISSAAQPEVYQIRVSLPLKQDGSVAIPPNT